MRSAIEHSFASRAQDAGQDGGHDRREGEAGRARDGEAGVRGIDDAEGGAVRLGGAVRASDLAFGLVGWPLSTKVTTGKGRELHLRGAADVVGVLMGDPEEIDRRVVQVGAELREESPVLGGARVAALGAAWAVAGVDEDVPSVGEIHERRERLADVVEVDSQAAVGGVSPRRARELQLRSSGGHLAAGGRAGGESAGTARPEPERALHLRRGRDSNPRCAVSPSALSKRVP